MDRFGSSREPVDGSRASALAAEIERAGWADEQSLLARHPSWEERQAIVEADAIVGLVNDRQAGTPNAARAARPVDETGGGRRRAMSARSGLHTRGVGRHGRAVLRATRMAATGHDLVLLTERRPA